MTYEIRFETPGISEVYRFEDNREVAEFWDNLSEDEKDWTTIFWINDSGVKRDITPNR